MTHIVHDAEGAAFVLDTSGRGSRSAAFTNLRARLDHQASVQAVLRDHANREAILAALVEVGACRADQTQLELEEIRPLLYGAMQAGAIALVPYRPSLRPSCDVDVMLAAEPLPIDDLEEETIEATHTLELELVDDHDEPVPDEPYRVQLPDGEVIEGRLDARGCAMLTGIPQGGTCMVSFPRLDEAVWSSA